MSACCGLRPLPGPPAPPSTCFARPSCWAPHAVGAKDLLPGPLAPLACSLIMRAGRLPVQVPVLVPALPLQLVHEEDVGRALLRCVVAAGPPGAYNIAADGIITAADIVRELGLLPLPVPAATAHVPARAIAALPLLPPVAQWVEAASHPAIMDTSRAKKELGWEPGFTALEAMQDTLRRGVRRAPARA